MSEQKLMKDGLAKAAISRIAKALSQCDANFDANAFQNEALKGLNRLELKERVYKVIEVMHSYLPQPFSKTHKVLQKLPSIWDFGDKDDPHRGFAAWPLIDYASIYGLDHPKASLKLIKKLTHLFSSEFAIRPFIQQDQKAALTEMLKWTTDKSEHVRRLASEGCRPRLPWGMQLKNLIKDPNPILPILETLKSDPSLYVRRSVANNINDISKDNPDIAIKLCQKWQKLNECDVDWVIKHALRSLIKSGDTRVFPLLGFEASPKITIETFTLSLKKVHIGNEITFDLTIKANQKKQKIVLDYAVHFMKANGTSSAKVFKLKELNLKKDEELSLSKKHSFKIISTRKYHLGEHFIAIHVNGKEQVIKSFELIEP